MFKFELIIIEFLEFKFEFIVKQFVKFFKQFVVKPELIVELIE
jgi:hypothetical protein